MYIWLNAPSLVNGCLHWLIEDNLDAGQREELKLVALGSFLIAFVSETFQFLSEILTIWFFHIFMYVSHINKTHYVTRELTQYLKYIDSIIVIKQLKRKLRIRRTLA